MALLLSPAGVGLSGVCVSTASLTQSIAGMGIDSSAVCRIAEAVSSNDTERIAQTTVVLRRTSNLLGTLGAALLDVSFEASLLIFSLVAVVIYGYYVL